MHTIRVNPLDAPCDASALERLRTLSTSVVPDGIERMSAIRGVRPIAPAPFPFPSPMVGQALTVRGAFGDNLAMHQALEMVAPGQVVVVDAEGDTGRAITGEIMTRYAASRGAVGIVVHGSVRDADALGRAPIPVFACGITHLGPTKDGPGEIGFPVAIGGVAVRQGDVVVGDGDGVAVIQLEELAAVVERAEAREAYEQEVLRSIDEGTYATGHWTAKVALERPDGKPLDREAFAGRTSP